MPVASMTVGRFRAAYSSLALPRAHTAEIVALERLGMSLFTFCRRNYPKTGRGDDRTWFTSASRGQVCVQDSYRWLEEGGEERNLWIEEQNALAISYTISYDSKALRKFLEHHSIFAKIEAPSFVAGRWYWMMRSGTQEHAALYRSKTDSLPSGGSLFSQEIYINPNSIEPTGQVSITNWAFSPDGKHVAYSTAQNGGDLNMIYIRPSNPKFGSLEDSTNPVDNLIYAAYGDFAWDVDSSGIFYENIPKLSEARSKQRNAKRRGSASIAKVYFHALGTLQEADKVVVSVDDPSTLFEVSSSSDGQYLILSISRDTTGRNKLWVSPLNNRAIDGALQWIKIQNNFNNSFQYISNDGNVFEVMTDEGSDRMHARRIDIAKSLESSKIPLLKDGRDLFLRQYLPLPYGWAAFVYSHDVKDELYVQKPDGNLFRLEGGFVGSFELSYAPSGFIALLSSYVQPGLFKRFIFDSSRLWTWKPWYQSTINGIDTSEFVMEQVWYKSKDGTSIPMYMVRHECTNLDGQAPCLMYAYGANSTGLYPKFSFAYIVFAKIFGGVVALPNIRGGSEFGNHWAEQGSKAFKTNSIDDFIACRDFLVKYEYISSKKIAAYGWSSSAELVFQAVSKAPEGSFNAIVANSGAYDMLRFYKFYPGEYWTGDMGDPRHPIDFDYIYPVSPLHNIPRNKALPPTLIIAGEQDVRMERLHACKMIATLQHVASNNTSIQLLRVLQNAGHADDETWSQSRSTQIEELSLRIGFIARSLGLAGGRQRRWPETCCRIA